MTERQKTFHCTPKNLNIFTSNTDLSTEDNFPLDSKDICMLIQELSPTNKGFFFPINQLNSPKKMFLASVPNISYVSYS